MIVFFLKKKKLKFPILASEDIQGWCNVNFSILVKLISLKFPESCPFLGFIHSQRLLPLDFCSPPILAGCAHCSGLSLPIVFPSCYYHCDLLTSLCHLLIATTQCGFSLTSLGRGILSFSCACVCTQAFTPAHTCINKCSCAVLMYAYMCAYVSGV